jgi:nitrite reductase (NADH) small subunit
MRHRILSVSELPPGQSREIVVAGKIVAVFNVDGTIHAIDGVCAHAGGPLGKGALRGDVVTCPWHGWQFNVATGRHCLAATISQRRYDVTVEGDDVFVELPE